MATAIRLMGIAAAAAVAYEIGKEQIDNAFKGKSDAIGNLSAVGAGAASMSGGIAKQKADADALRAAIAKARSEQGGFVSTLFGSMVHGAGSQVDEMGNPTGVIDSSASGMPDLEGTMGKQIAEMEQLLKEKEARIAQLENPAAGGKVDGKAVADAIKAGAPLRVEVVNQPSPQATSGRAGPGGSRGVKPPAAHAPGGGVG